MATQGAFAVREEKIAVSRAKRWHCPCCGATYTKQQVWFNGWVARWCRNCFKNGESSSDCVLEVIE